MKKSITFKRMLASVLSASLMFNSITPAFAEALEPGLKEVHRNSPVEFQEILDYAKVNDETSLSIELTHQIGEWVISKAIEGAISGDIPYYFNEASSANTATISFPSGGTYYLSEAVGEVGAVLNDEAKAQIKPLEDEYIAANEEVKIADKAENEAQAALTVEKGKVLAAKTAYDLAKDAESKALTEYEKAKADKAKAEDDLNNFESRIAEKKAELAQQKADLEKSKQDLASTQKAIDDAFAATTAAGYSREEVKTCATVGGIHNHKFFNPCSIAWSAVTSLEAELASRQAAVDEQIKAVEQNEAFLDSNDKEEVRKPFIDAAAQAAVAETEALNKYTAKQGDAAAALVTYQNADAAAQPARDAHYEAQIVVSEKMAAKEAIQERIHALLDSFTMENVTYNRNEVDFFKPDNAETFAFDIAVYDILTLEVVDVLGSFEGASPDVDVSSNSAIPKLSDNTEGNKRTISHKIPEGAAVNITAENLYKHTLSTVGITLDENNSCVVTLSNDKTLTFNYTEVGASTILFESSDKYSVEVTSGDRNVASGETVRPGREVALNVQAKPGFKVNSYKVYNVSGEEVRLVNDKFTTNDSTPDQYTIEVKTEFIGSMVTLAEYDNSKYAGVSMKVNGQPVNFGDIIADVPIAGTRVTIIPEAVPGFEVESVVVEVIEGSDPDLTVWVIDDNFEFTARSGRKYQVTLPNEVGSGLVDVRSRINAALDEIDANVKMTVNGEDYIPGEPIIPGSEVTIEITPKNNTYIKDAQLVGRTREALPEFAKEKGVWKLTFEIGKLTAYTLEVEVASPIVEANALDITLNRYDIEHNNWDKVKAEIAKGFTLAEGVVPKYQYNAGAIEIPGINMVIPIVLDIETEELNLDVIAGKVWGIINDINPLFGNMVSKNAIKDILKTLESGTIHYFGDADTEEVYAIFEGSDKYAAASDSRQFGIEDLRTEIDLDINEEISVAYGSYLSNDAIIAALLAGKAGVVVEGKPLGEEYNARLSIDTDMSGLDVGTYTVTVMMEGDEYYKDSEYAQTTVKVVKADSIVKATDNNVILYKNIGGLTSNYLVSVTPGSEVLVADSVEHIRFLMGLDANTNDPAQPEFTAVIDLSATALNSDLFGKNLANELIALIDAEGDGLTISEVVANADKIAALIAALGVDVETVKQFVDVEALKDALMEAVNSLSEYAEYGDVRVRLVNNADAIVPNSHGVYVVGAITIDKNYTTAADVAPFVITAEPVEVKFKNIDENGTIKVKYNGQAREAIAQAFNAQGAEVNGEMKYIYVGVSSQVEAYMSAKAPTDAGTYLVLATFNDRTYHHAGAGSAILKIEGANIVISAEDVTIECDCGCDTVTCGSTFCVENGHSCAVEHFIVPEFASSTNALGINYEYITVIEDEDGNINVIIPDSFSDKGETLYDKLPEEIKGGIQKALTAIDNLKLAEILAALENSGVADALGLKGIEANGSIPTICGEYKVTFIAYAPNHEVATKTAKFIITTPEHECSGGVATCKTLAVCDVCGESYGELAPDNHEGEIEIRDAVEATYLKGGYTGDKYWDCCDTLEEKGHKTPALVWGGDDDDDQGEKPPVNPDPGPTDPEPTDPPAGDDDDDKDKPGSGSGNSGSGNSGNSGSSGNNGSSGNSGTPSKPSNNSSSSNKAPVEDTDTEEELPADKEEDLDKEDMKDTSDEEKTDEEQGEDEEKVEPIKPAPTEKDGGFPWWFLLLVGAGTFFFIIILFKRKKDDEEEAQ